MASFGHEQNGGAWRHFCGGAVISDSTIVTASHCFPGGTVNSNTKIRLGDQNLNDGVDDDNTYDIKKIVLHQDYMGWGPQYDLAIVYTTRKIQYNERIKPICIPTRPFDEANKYANNEVKFTGWGYYDAVNDFSNDLREATFKVLPESQCFSSALYEPRIKYKDIIFCAGHEVNIITVHAIRMYHRFIFLVE